MVLCFAILILLKKYAAHNLFGLCKQFWMPLNFRIYCIWCDNTIKDFTFVSPAMGATLQTFLDRRVLMIELFPTLG